MYSFVKKTFGPGERLGADKENQLNGKHEMKATYWMGMIAAVAAILVAGEAFAAGGKGPQHRAGSANGSTLRTATMTQTRQQLRDGSCLQTGPSSSATQGGIRQRLRDGSCLTK